MLSTTFCHGPGQSVGGAKSNVCASNPMNVNSSYSVTTHGSVGGGGMSGSATATSPDPIGGNTANAGEAKTSAANNAGRRRLRMADMMELPLLRERQPSTGERGRIRPPTSSAAAFRERELGLAPGGKT